jgi:tetratricopeptide (TPR) repeat protein
LREAAEELRAHGRPGDAARFWERSLASLAAAGESPSVRAATLYALGRYAEALPLVDSLLASEGRSADYLGLRGTLAARLGDSAGAARLSAQLAAQPRKYNFGVPTLWRARIAAVRGQADSAVALLKLAFAEGREYDLWLHRDGDLQGLRDYPPFAALVRPRD